MAQQLAVFALTIACVLLGFNPYVSAASGLLRDYPSFPEGQQHPLRLAAMANPKDSLREEVRKLEIELSTKNIDSSDKDYVAICAIVKDQNKDLQEWIEYHLGIGVSHVIVYDDGSSVPVSTVLANFIEAGQATVIPIQPSDWQRNWSDIGPQVHGLSAQPYAYTSCHRDFRDRYDWLAFIDLDEFFVLAHDADTLPAFLRQFEAFSSVAINQRVMGSSGHTDRPEGGVMRNFVSCAPLTDEAGNSNSWEAGNSRWFKSIINTHHVGPPFFQHPHFPAMCSNWTFDYLPPCVDTNMRPLAGWQTLFPVAIDKIVIYHYMIKSFEEFMEKRARGDVMNNPIRTIDQFKYVDDFCTAECSVLAERARQEGHAGHRPRFYRHAVTISAAGSDANTNQDSSDTQLLSHTL